MHGNKKRYDGDGFLTLEIWGRQRKHQIKSEKVCRAEIIIASKIVWMKPKYNVYIIEKINFKVLFYWFKKILLGFRGF